MTEILDNGDILCDEVHPNVGVEYAYAHALLVPIGTMAAEVEAALTADWSRGVNPVGFASDAPNLMLLVQRSLDRLTKRWEGNFQKMEHRIADKFASSAWTATDNGVRASFAKAGFTVKFKPTRAMKDAYAVRVQANVDLIRTIPQQYLKDVKTQVWNAVTAGSDMSRLTADIQRVYNVTQHRASFIARDQNNKAKAAFEDARRKELGIEEAIWTHSSAGKEPRTSHVWASQHRVRYKISEGWLDPAVNKHIWPGTEINCRCMSRAIIPGVSLKRLSAKQVVANYNRMRAKV
jgi:uncharacterized protein with gpF-like domain